VIPTPQSSGTGNARWDLQNARIDEVAAAAGRCGAIHLPTGRTCGARARHADSCDLRARVMPRALRRRLAASSSGTLGAELARRSAGKSPAPW
jgi:hypothetical protein